MKKILMLILIFATGFFAANAQDEAPLVISAGQLKNLHFGSDMNVTLVHADDAQADVKMATEVFEKLSVSVENETLYINSRSKLKHTDRVVVVVASLERLTVGINTKVNTEGILLADEMKVFVRSGAKARIVTKGDVNVFSLDDSNISVTKRPIRLNTKLM